MIQAATGYQHPSSQSNTNVEKPTFINSAKTNLTTGFKRKLSYQFELYGRGYITLYQIKAVGRYLDILTPHGRMGLTNYEMQGVLGAIMFSFWGFGSFFSTLGATELFVLGIIIYFSQMLFSKYWLKYFLYGPLEWLWRSGTYLKWQQMRRK